MPIPEDKARKLAELEAQVAKEPSNPNLHRKWITERVNAECIPGGGENPRRIAMISWAVVELKRRLSMQGHTPGTRSGFLHWIALYLSSLGRWEDAANAYDEFWSHSVSEKMEDMDWYDLKFAADAYERAGRSEDAKRALSDWMAWAISSGEGEEWEISDIAQKLAAFSR